VTETLAFLWATGEKKGNTLGLQRAGVLSVLRVEFWKKMEMLFDGL
jgi:hypothetical protein